MSGFNLRVLARIRLLSASEGGRTAPIRNGYRPNHNFSEPDNRVLTVGFIELPDGVELRPGDSLNVEITFWARPGLREDVYPGRVWRIQEGEKLVGFGKVLELTSPWP